MSDRHLGVWQARYMFATVMAMVVSGTFVRIFWMVFSLVFLVAYLRSEEE